MADRHGALEDHIAQEKGDGEEDGADHCMAPVPPRAPEEPFPRRPGSGQDRLATREPPEGLAPDP